MWVCVCVCVCVCAEMQCPMSNVRPIGTNLVLVRRVRANNLLSMKAKREEGLTVWGPEAAEGPLAGFRGRAPAGVQGQRPRSSWVLAFVKGPERLSPRFFSPSNQPTSTWYRNVSTLEGTAPNPKFSMF